MNELEKSRKEQENFIRFVNKLDIKYRLGKITKFEREFLIKSITKGLSIKQYIEKLNQRIHSLEKIKTKKTFDYKRQVLHSAFVVFLFIGLVYFFLSPTFTGFITFEDVKQYSIIVDQSYSAGITEYNFNVKNLSNSAGNITSIKINGKYSGQFKIYVLRENESAKYMIYDSVNLSKEDYSNLITGLAISEETNNNFSGINDTMINDSEIINDSEPIVEPEIINDNEVINDSYLINDSEIVDTNESMIKNISESTENISESIIDYTNYSLNDSADYSINDSADTNITFNESIDLSNLSTEISNITDNITNETSEFEEVFVNVTINQTIGLNETLVNVSENLTQNITELIIYTDLFDECQETCNIDISPENLLLVIEVDDNSSFYLESIIFLQKIQNNPPIQIKQIPDLAANQSINLSEYFMDPDNDELFYDIYSVDGLSLEIDNNIARFVLAGIDTASTFIYATDGEELINSSMFTITTFQPLNTTLNVSELPFSVDEKLIDEWTSNPENAVRVIVKYKEESIKYNKKLNEYLSDIKEKAEDEYALKDIDGLRRQLQEKQDTLENAENKENKKSSIVRITSEQDNTIEEEINNISMELKSADELKQIIDAKDFDIKQSSSGSEAAELNITQLMLLKQNDNIEAVYFDNPVNLLLNDVNGIVKLTDAREYYFNSTTQELNGQGFKICVLDTGMNSDVVENVVDGFNVIDNSTNYSDVLGHGTSVGYIIYNISPSSEIIAVKVINDAGAGYESDILAGLDYCYDQNVSIISLSIGAGTSSGYCDENPVAEKVNELADSGILVIAGAGNDGSGSVKVPACARNALAVGASTKSDELASFSSFNNATLLVAPGENIATKNIVGEATVLSGTSMSTPIVSAVSALMMQGAENFTSMNSTEKKYYLIHTGDLINDTQRLFSRINTYNALTENITNDLTEGNLSVSNATIINYTTLTAPTINAVTLNSTYGTNLSSENLTASFTISSGNAAFNTTDWHINGTSIAVLNMPFNKQVTSTTANAVPDYTTYVRNGTLGSSTLTPAWTSSGYIGGGYDFDEDVGAEDRITFTDFTPSSTTPWTFTSWVYLRDTADDAFYAGDTGYYNALRFNKLSGYMGIRQDNGSSYYTTIQSNVIRNKWAMVTWVANGAGVLSLYINGTIQDAILSNTGITFNCLGHCYGSSGNSFYGILDEVMLFNRSLSSEQIAYLYQESLNKRMMQIHYEETEKGENWSVAITSNNGTADGNTVLSDGLIIIDNAPTVSLTSPSNYSKQNSSVGFTATITDDAETTKVELYTNDTGSWASRETRYPGESIYNRTGLQALYHFNNESEFAESVSRIYDFSGRGNNLTCGTCGTVGHVGVIDEAWYKAYTDAISYNSTANFNLGAVTVTFWMKDSEKVNPCIFDIIVAGTGGGYFCFNYTSTDRPILSLSSTNYRYFNSAGQDAIDGLWHFIVVRTPGNAQNDIANATLRIDGVDIPVYSTVNTSAPPSFDGILIGSADGSGSYDYEGYLDEFAVFNRYLSDAEVDAIYNARNTEKYSMQAVFQNRTLAEGDYLWNVKATDKYSQVGWAASNNTFWVGNKAPVVSSVVLSSTSGNNYTTDNLSVTFTATDSDGNALYNVTDWRRNSQSIAVLNMPFNRNITSTTSGAVKDYSTYGNNGTLAASTATPIWTSSGKVGGAYVFDGVNDYINLPVALSSSFGNSQSISAWVFGYNSMVTDTLDIISFQYSDADRLVFMILNGSGNPYIYDDINDRGALLGNTTLNLLNNQWHHVFFTCDTSGKKLYVDSVLSISDSDADCLDQITSPYTPQLGIHGSVYNQFNGSIDEVLIFNRSLSAEEIAKIYSEQSAGKAVTTMVSNETVVGENWSVAVTSTDTINDSTTVLSNNLTIVNAVPVVSSVVLNSTSGNNLTSDNLTVSFTATDSDNDPLFNVTDWRRNSQSIAVLNMPFNRNITSTTSGAVKDYSTYGNNGTLGGGTAGYAPAWTSSGKVGGAYDFDGNDNYISVDIDASIVNKNSYTVMGWFKEDSGTSTERQIYSEKQIASNTPLLLIKINNGGSDNQFRAVQRGDGSTVVGVTHASTLAENQWHHFAWVRVNATLFQLYINGTYSNSSTGNPGTTTIDDISIGADYYTGSLADFFSGLIDELLVFNRSLSAEEIAVIYANQSAGKAVTTLVRNETSIGDVWSVAVTSTDTISDSTATASNSLTIANSAPTTPSTPSITSPTTANKSSTLTSSSGTGSTDDDGDPLVYYYRWKNDTSTLQESTSTTLDCNSVPGCIVRGNITVAVRAHDGTVYSSYSSESAVKLIANVIPLLTSIADTAELVNASQTQIITPTGQDDFENQSLTLVCCKDTSDACTPTSGTNICTGGNYANQAAPYSSMTCTYPVGTSSSTEYVRCRAYDSFDYSSTTASENYVIDETDPTCSVASIDELANASYSNVSSTTIYYNTLVGGSFMVNVSASDTGGGSVRNVTFPLTVSNGGADTSSPYSLTYNWDISDTYSQAATINVYDTLDNINTCTFNVTRDVTAPSGGSITYSSANQSSVSVSITYNIGSDAGAGLNVSAGAVLRQECAMSSGVCAPSGSWTVRVTEFDGSYSDTGTTDYCYKYLYHIDDNVNNEVNYTSANVVCIDSSAPTCSISSIDELANASYSNVSGSTIYYNTLVGGLFNVNVSASDTGIGIKNVTFPLTVSNGGADTSSPYNWTYYWDSTDTFSTSGNITVYNNAGGTGMCYVNVTRDVTAPSGGSISHTNATQADTSISITYSTGSDGDSGLATSTGNILRQECTMSSGRCAPSGTWTSIATESDGSYTDTGTNGECYSYRYNIDDNVNNEVNYTNANIACVNAVPSVSSVVLSSTSGNNYTTDNLTVSFTATDADSDALYNNTDWRRNSQSIAVLNMPFNRNISSTSSGAVKDYSSFGNNGTLGNGSAGTAPVWNLSGINGGAFIFDGTNDAINVGAPIIGSNPIFSISAWFKTSDTNRCFIYSEGNSTSDTPHLYITVSEGAVGNVCWVYDGNSEYSNGCTSASGYNDGAWHHAVLVSLNTSHRLLYIDGAVKTEASSSSSVSAITVNQAYIGVLKRINFGDYFNGSIDEVLIFNRSLSAEEIAAIYANQSVGKAVTTLADDETEVGENWSVAVTSTDTVNDSTTVLSNNLTIVNAIPTMITSTILPTTAYRNESLRGYCNATDADSTNLYYYYKWFLNNALNTSGSVGPYTQATQINVANITNTSLAVGQNWTLECKADDLTANSTAMNSSVKFINTLTPEKVNLKNPTNGNTTIHPRQPLFEWYATNATSRYEINITSSSGCGNNYYQNVTAPTLNFTPTSELCLQTESTTRYDWKVRACSIDTCGTWSDQWNFSIEPYVAITLNTATVSFGTIGLNEQKNTTSDNPAPFSLQNDGNVQADLVNVSSSQSLWISQPLNSEYFQMKARASTETYSFNNATSLMNFVNVTGANTSLIRALNYSDNNDSAYVDIKVLVPGDEPPGAKQTSILFSWEQTP